VIRFLVYRHWVFRERRPGPGTQPAGPPALTGQALRTAVPSLDINTNGHHQ